MKKVFLTGATGVMGRKGLVELLAYPEKYKVTVLARDSKKNRKFLNNYIKRGVEVIWGDLKDQDKVSQGVKTADIVLHVGGMVSPSADWYPVQTIETNLKAIRNIISAAQELDVPPAIVYIGSVAQFGHRDVPDHWGECGDKLEPAFFDAYAYSKTEAERLLAESGLPKWVSLRQTGILHSGLLMNAQDPIAFHVPLQGVLEWVTADDSGRLLERVCRDEVPDEFWNNFYNIGGGKEFRMTNYEFEKRLLNALGCPPPEKVFETNWFATGNFHGIWYKDSDRLEEILHFREGITPEEYFERMRKELPWFFSLSPLAPAFLMKAIMKKVAHTPELGPMWWVKHNKKERISAAFGSMEKWERIPGWDKMDLKAPDKSTRPESKKPSYNLGELKKYASSREGKCLSENIKEGDPEIEVEFECKEGHRFHLKSRTALRGGHWCEKCLFSRTKLNSK